MAASSLQPIDEDDDPAHRRETAADAERVRATVRAYIVDNFLLGENEAFGEDDSLVEAGIVDSTGVLELVSFLEERFGIRVTDEDMSAENLDSIEAMAGFVERKLTGRASGLDATGDGQPS